MEPLKTAIHLIHTPVQRTAEEIIRHPLTLRTHPSSLLHPSIYLNVLQGADLKKKMTAPDSSKTISQETMRNLLVNPAHFHIHALYMRCIHLCHDILSCHNVYSHVCPLFFVPPPPGPPPPLLT